MKRLSLLVSLAIAAVLLIGPTAASQSEEGLVVVPDSDEVQVDVQVRNAQGQPQSRFRIDDEVQIRVNTRAQNADRVYLYLVDIDAAGRCVRIFPNAFSPNPRVSTGQLILPDKSSYRFRVVPPEGTEYVQAFASLEPINVFQQMAMNDDAFPQVCTNPEEFANQVRASIQGIIAESKVATDWTSFQVGRQQQNQAPNAAFNVSDRNPRAGNSVRLDASPSFDPDGRIARYQWSFGDGTSATGRTVQHAYRSAGRYTVTLRVTDDRGATSSASQRINVQAPSNQAPTASFSLSPSNPSVGETVRFESNSFDDDGRITGQRWRFGDGAQASGSPVFHRYQRSGTYTVTLTVTDDRGATTSTSQQIQVGSSQPQPSQSGIFVNAIDDNRLRVVVQGQSNWFSDHGYRLELLTNGAFTSVERRSSGNVASQGLEPTPSDPQELELTGAVRSGRVEYTIGVSDDASKLKFRLLLDTDGDGQLERNKRFVFLGSAQKNPPSNPFVIDVQSGGLTPFVDLRICVVLVDQPGFQFTVCFNFQNL